MKVVVGTLLYIFVTILIIFAVLNVRRLKQAQDKLIQFRRSTIQDRTFNEIEKQDALFSHSSKHQALFKWLKLVLYIMLIMMIGMGIYVYVNDTAHSGFISLSIGMFFLVNCGVLYSQRHKILNQHRKMALYLLNHPENLLQVQPYPNNLIADYRNSTKAALIQIGVAGVCWIILSFI